MTAKARAPKGLILLAGILLLLPAAAQADEARLLRQRIESRPAPATTVKLPSAPSLGARERAPFDPVTSNRIQRYQSNSRAVIRSLDRKAFRAPSKRTRQLRKARGNLSRFQRGIQRRR